MDESKMPYQYALDAELQEVKQLVFSPLNKFSPSPPQPIQQTRNSTHINGDSAITGGNRSDNSCFTGDDDFPPLSRLNLRN